MIPESKLVWSTVKPTFEEVKGKKVKVISLFPDGDLESNLVTINSDTTYEVMFDEQFICYADLTIPVSPLPLWGKLPEIYQNDVHVIGWNAEWRHCGECHIINGATLELAILAWNRIAEALNEVER